MLTPWRLFLCQMALNVFYHITKASLCLGGQDIFATVRENSPIGEFIANLSIIGDPGASSIRLCLTGENADWFYLEGKSIRLNSSFSRVLDREILGSILIASLTCYEDEVVRSRYRIMVEILNENDNRPFFIEDTIQPRYISEMVTVNSMVFTVKARDRDGDTLTYIIDKSTTGASYFRIDLPNSGMVILDKPLDYEIDSQLLVVIHAMETNTKEKYSTTATVTVNVLDGDDQYPQFQPCAPVYEDGDHNICTNPVYSVNITETDEDTLLYFSPGPIHAEDGDKDILTPVVYSILSGDDNGRFTIDSRTGEITLNRRVENRLLTPLFRLRIMAAQFNDPKKYSTATALVQVLSENRFPPFFNNTVYKGFLIESSSPASLVTTYGNQVLVVQAIDRDFRDGINPKIHYTIQPSSKLYHITQDGIVIGKTDLLRAFNRHILEVIATDEESGEAAQASLDIEVLPRGTPAVSAAPVTVYTTAAWETETVPRSAFGEERLFGEMNPGMAGSIAAIVLIVAVTAMFIFLWLVKRRRERREPVDRGAIALGKHPNVVNSGHPISLIEDSSYHNEAFIDHERTSDLYNNNQDTPFSMQDMLPILVLPELTPTNPSSTGQINGNAKSVSFKDEVKIEDAWPNSERVVSQQKSFPLAAAGNLTETEGFACANPSVSPRDEYTISSTEEDDNPYRNMASVIYSSDDDDSTEVEANDLRQCYKRTINQLKAIGMQMQDSDESQA